MNITVTRTAEDLPPRRAFTALDISRMVDAGVLSETDRIELIEGEIVVMSAKSVAHDNVQNALNLALVRAVPDGFYVGNASTLQLSDDVLVEPDLAVISRDLYKAPPTSFARPRSEDILLLIEIAVSSIAYDRGVKARLYASHGIREFWVIDANERVAWIHSGPSGDGWSSITRRGPDELLSSPLLPGFAVRLGDIE